MTTRKELLQQLLDDLSTLAKCYWLPVILLLLAACLENVLAAFANSGFAYRHTGLGNFISSTMISLPVPLALFALCLGGNKRWSRIASFCFCLLQGTFIVTTLFLFITQDNFLTAYYYDVMAGTTWHEAIGFLSLYKSTVTLIIVMLAGLVILCWKTIHQKPYTLHFPRIAYLGILIVPLLGLTLFSLTRFKDLQALWFRPVALRNFINYLRVKDVSDIGRRKSIPDNISLVKGSVLGVVILGESASRNHLGCYGYKRNTTPYMSKRDWIKFNDVMTSLPVTNEACRYMFTDQSLHGDVMTTSIPLILSLTPGCSIDYVSMQGRAKFGTLEALFQQCTKTVYLDMSAKKDLQIVDYLQQNNIVAPGKKLLILHLWGSHVPFNKSYPQEFNIFGEGSEDNSFDNSILFTDFVIEKIIQELAAYEFPVWVLYVSDHGESPGHGIRSFASYNSWEIPFTFWFNEEYQRQYPETIKSLENHIDVPFQTDCCFEIILYMMGISWDGFRYDRLPFYDDYQVKKRILKKITDRHPAALPGENINDKQR